MCNRLAIRACSLLMAVMCIQDMNARCGAVDYSWGADGLAEATSFVGTMMIYTVDILYAVAGIVTIVSALQIYMPMCSKPTSDKLRKS